MPFPARLPFALLLASLNFLYCPISMAQSSVLTGSVNHTYMPKMISQNQIPTTQVRVVPQRQIQYVPVIRERPIYRTVYYRDNRTFFQRHPKVKAVAIGAGVGAGVGAIAGAISRRGIGRGALIGAGTGAGVGLVRSSRTLRRHPIIRNVATGSLVGLGLGGAIGRGSRRALQGAGIGAAVGLGASLLNGDFR